MLHATPPQVSAALGPPLGLLTPETVYTFHKRQPHGGRTGKYSSINHQGAVNVCDKCHSIVGRTE